MKVLLLGSGGREHAMARALERGHHDIVWAPGNGAQGAWRRMPVDLKDLEQVTQLARQERPELTLVGPEDPLAAGLVDRLQAEGLRCWGPTAHQAQLESSKAWAKEFMSRWDLPTAPFQVVKDVEDCQSAVAELWTPGGVVIKADGLAAGKGVVVTDQLPEAVSAAQDFLAGAFEQVVVERRLLGPEASLILLLRPDGFQAFPLVRDHKRLLAGDRGPNTGGMGAFFPLPENPDLQPLLSRLWEGLVEEGLNYFGALFVGLMLTPEGPQILEFNCRLGDPETEVLLEALQSDFLDTLEGQPMRLQEGAWLDLVLASSGYPHTSQKGQTITGWREVHEVRVLHAGTEVSEEGQLVTAGGRVLHLVANGSDLEQARHKAHHAARQILFGEGPPIWREDIGATLVRHS